MIGRHGYAPSEWSDKSLSDELEERQHGLKHTDDTETRAQIEREIQLIEQEQQRRRMKKIGLA
jgi:hypothetical protein